MNTTTVKPLTLNPRYILASTEVETAGVGIIVQFRDALPAYVGPLEGFLEHYKALRNKRRAIGKPDPQIHYCQDATTGERLSIRPTIAPTNTAMRDKLRSLCQLNIRIPARYVFTCGTTYTARRIVQEFNSSGLDLEPGRHVFWSIVRHANHESAVPAPETTADDSAI